MKTLTARVVRDDGQLGAVVGASSYRGAELVHDGCDAIASQLAAMAAGGRRTEREAYDLLAGEPWSNGKIWIGATE